MSDLRISEAFLYMDYLCFRALCCKGPPPARPEYDLVCIGLTGSGKTSLLSKLCSESPDSVVSTTGGYCTRVRVLFFPLTEMLSFASYALVGSPHFTEIVQ